MPWIEGTCIDFKGPSIDNAIPKILAEATIMCLPIDKVEHLQVALV
jgi:hypothetical protein